MNDIAPKDVLELLSENIEQIAACQLVVKDRDGNVNVFSSTMGIETLAFFAAAVDNTLQRAMGLGKPTVTETRLPSYAEQKRMEQEALVGEIIPPGQGKILTPEELARLATAGIVPVSGPDPADKDQFALDLSDFAEALTPEERARLEKSRAGAELADGA